MRVCQNVLFFIILTLLNVKSDGTDRCCRNELIEVCAAQCTDYCASYCQNGNVLPDLKRLTPPNEFEVFDVIDCREVDCDDMTPNIKCTCEPWYTCPYIPIELPPFYDGGVGVGDVHDDGGDTINNYCFAVDGVVETLNRGIISLEKLQAGDHVRDSLNGFTEVVGFLHRDMFIKQDFLELSTNVSKIVATNEHLLLTEYGFANAENIKPGMNLVMVNNLHQEVVRVSTVTKIGVIAPLTKSGVFSVNGFQVSCYAHIPSQLHWLVDLLMWPRKQFVWSQDGIDAYAVVLNFILYFPWKLSYFL